MAINIKQLIQTVRDKLDEFQTEVITDNYKISLNLQQRIEKYNYMLNMLLFIYNQRIDLNNKKRQYTCKKNDDVFRIANKIYRDFNLFENIILNNDFHDLLPDVGVVINIE